MRLYSLTLRGYRRFEDSWMNLEGRVVAIVGPNEAGKSSVLSALQALNDDDPVSSSAITRGMALGAADEVMYVRFRLDEDERALSRSPMEKTAGLWLIVAKTVAGTRTYRLEPSPTRSQLARRKGQSAAAKALASKWFARFEAAAQPTSEDDATASLTDQLGQVSTDLASEAPNLSPEVLVRLEALIAELQSGTLPEGTPKGAIQGLIRLQRALGEALESERLPDPSVVTQDLRDRVPAFLDFDDLNRSLRSEYDLANPDDAASPALTNLAAVADLPLPALQDAIAANDTGRIRSLIESAQQRLNTALSDAWKQSALTISFDRQDSSLRITVSSHGSDYFALEDRSDGLRTFIALRVFLARRQYPVRPILLVDEAESHLHYDAQADIIRVFEQQSEVAEVIYTTHSIGCLPQDLGRGVRVVEPEEIGTRSRIENVWSRGAHAERKVGITPLMLAMGASTIPLTPTRFVVVAEGPSDAMLLPSMLREATGLDVLGYQVVGGLSQASDSDLARLSLEAPRVVYLVDGDQGGGDLFARLRAVGVPPKRLVRWASPTTGICLEDAVEPSLYVNAINTYLAKWPPHKGGLTRSVVTKAARPTQIAKWCEANTISNPSKVLIAQEILSILDNPSPPADLRLVDPSRASLLRELHKKLFIALEITTVD